MTSYGSVSLTPPLQRSGECVTNPMVSGSQEDAREADTVEAVMTSQGPKYKLKRTTTLSLSHDFRDRDSVDDERLSLTGDKPDEHRRTGTYTADHCHTDATNTPGVDKKARRQLIIACTLCLLFMIAEIVGGILANSLALATDAAHLLTDFASFLISLFALYIAARPATRSMSFGWHRAEVMGAVISVLLIWVVTGILVYMAAERVASGDYEVNGKMMAIIAALGVVFNLVMLATLHDHGHSHGGHGHSHGNNTHAQGSNTRARGSNKDAHGIDNHAHSGDDDAHGDRVTKNNLANAKSDNNTDKEHSNRSYQNASNGPITNSAPDIEGGKKDKMKKKTNINIRAAFIHVLGDLLQSIGVLIAALVIFFKPDYKIADPICTFIFSVLVLFTTINILRDAVNVLMEGTPPGISFEYVQECLTAIPGVLELHNLRIWSLTTNRVAVSVHLALAPEADHPQVSRLAGSVLREEFNVHECTIQTEQFVDDMKDCSQCQNPSH